MAGCIECLETIQQTIKLLDENSSRALSERVCALHSEWSRQVRTSQVMERLVTCLAAPTPELLDQLAVDLKGSTMQPDQQQCLQGGIPDVMQWLAEDKAHISTCNLANVAKLVELSKHSHFTPFLLVLEKFGAAKQSLSEGGGKARLNKFCTAYTAVTTELDKIKVQTGHVSAMFLGTLREAVADLLTLGMREVVDFYRKTAAQIQKQALALNKVAGGGNGKKVNERWYTTREHEPDFDVLRVYSTTLAAIDPKPIEKLKSDLDTLVADTMAGLSKYAASLGVGPLDAYVADLSNAYADACAALKTCMVTKAETFICQALERSEDRRVRRLTEFTSQLTASAVALRSRFHYSVDQFAVNWKALVQKDLVDLVSKALAAGAPPALPAP